MATDHPFRNDPQWSQQYAGGLGYKGNGIGSVTGIDPLLSEEGGDFPRRGRPKSPKQVDQELSVERRTVGDLLDQAGLTPKQRFVVELRHGIRGGEPLTHREIALLMGVTHRAVQDLERAAKKKLAKILAIDT